MRHSPAFAGVALLQLACVGCAATIHRHGDVPSYEAELADSNASSLILKLDDKRFFSVPVEEVRDIDHPGNVMMVIGGALGGLCLLLGGVASVDATLRRDLPPMLAVYGGASLGLLLGGAIPYLKSLSAASRLRPPTPPPAEERAPPSAL